MVKIEFTSNGSSAKFGNFEPGDTATCTEAEAKHFIEDAQCAKYYKPPAKVPAAASQTSEAAARKSVARKSAAPTSATGTADQPQKA